MDTSRTCRLAAALVFAAFASPGVADTIRIIGMITQSTADGTGPAVNNPALNSVADGDAFAVTLNFAGAITAPSSTPYDLTGGSLVFLDTTSGATESLFGGISLSVAAIGAWDNLSLLGCLTSGTSCADGNFVTANFQIAASALNSQNVAVTPLDEPHPLDLLEDDGTTDLHGAISTYSYISTSTTATPEPSIMGLMGLALAVGLLKRSLGPEGDSNDRSDN